LLLGDDSRTLDLPAAGALAIGRQEGSDVWIPDPSVSRRHAVLHVGEKLVIEDLGGANGTMIVDRPSPSAQTETLNMRHVVKKQAELTVGDTLLFGAARVLVRRAPDVDAPNAEADGEIVLDPAMRGLYAEAALAAPTPINVLLLGETGVGKEVLARAIHARSSRKTGPFCALNCAALSNSLIESELFGHEKGAFTGAVQARGGVFEAASGGTLLLDEVGELAPPVQAKLLRVLEEKVVVRVGSTRARQVDARIIAATNRNLEADVADGRFRRDLYYRLNGLSLSIPPLRERPLELEPLARRFLAGACRLMERRDAPMLSEEALACMRAYAWPGNVRELRQVMERAAVLCPSDRILPTHLPRSLTKGADGPASSRSQALPDEIRSLERTRIVEALERVGGVQSEAARALGISRRTLISRIEGFGLPRPRKGTAP
jgi:transcriptional regulator with PAS, ATPase and Fis domain